MNPGDLTATAQGRLSGVIRETAASGSSGAPQPSFQATGILLAGLALTAASLTGETAAGVARYAAIGCGLSLALSLFAEMRKDTGNLLRADIVAMLALYFLLFFEFLFPQRRFDELVPYPEAIFPGIRVCLWGFAAIAIGRHCVSRHVKRWHFVEAELTPGRMLMLFWISFAIGYFNMVLAVDFNPIAMVEAFMGPRFAVPWGREKFGDARALLYELSAMLYLVPPLAGVILGRRKGYSSLALFTVFLGLLFTLFYGFCTGTRNIIASYLITFMAAYFYSSSASRRHLLLVAILVFGLLVSATYYEIRFRNVGLLNYLQTGQSEASEEEEEMTLYIDYNLHAVGALVSVFPNQVPYIGWQAPLWMVARPIPRALWPGKPDGSAVSPENVFGLEGVTVAATFVGESYMSAGLLGVIIAAVLVGMLARWWTQKAFSRESGFGILIYGSGFFAIVITMRSMYLLPVAILPTIAAAVLGHFLRRSPERGPVSIARHA
jgi:oligosaccharide repeat unit polymerase